MGQQLIVTTKDELTGMLQDVVAKLRPTISNEAMELERLKRKETLTSEEVEKLYSLNANSLRKARTNGEGPEYIKHGSLVLYSHKAVQKYLEARRMKTHV